MKNYDEIAKEVFERIDEYNIAQKRKRKIYKKAAFSLCSVCIIMLAGFGIFKSGILSTPQPTGEIASSVKDELNYFDGALEEDSAKGNDKTGADGSVWTKDGEKLEFDNRGEEFATSSAENSTSSETDISNDGAKSLCYINQIDSTTSADIAEPDSATHYHEDWDNNKALNFLGIDLSAINESFNLDSYNHGAWYRKEDNALVWDYAHFGYSNEKNKFQLSASKTEMPRDCIVVTNDDIKETRIGSKNGSVKVKFFGTTGTQVQVEEQPEKQKKMIAEFENNGVYFRVEANDISVYDFYKIVSAIING